MAKKNPFKSKSLWAAYDRYIDDDPERAQAFEQALADYDVAQKIHALRTRAKLSQRELARRIGTKDRATVRKFADETGLAGSATGLLDGREARRPYGPGLPQVYVIGHDGRVRYAHHGWEDGDEKELRKQVEKVL